jgi:hypothetical protein
MARSAGHGAASRIQLDTSRLNLANRQLLLLDRFGRRIRALV